MPADKPRDDSHIEQYLAGLIMGTTSREVVTDGLDKDGYSVSYTPVVGDMVQCFIVAKTTPYPRGVAISQTDDVAFRKALTRLSISV